MSCRQGPSLASAGPEGMRWESGSRPVLWSHGDGFQGRQLKVLYLWQGSCCSSLSNWEGSYNSNIIKNMQQNHLGNFPSKGSQAPPTESLVLSKEDLAMCALIGKQSSCGQSHATSTVWSWGSAEFPSPDSQEHIFFPKFKVKTKLFYSPYLLLNCKGIIKCSPLCHLIPIWHM